MGTFVVQLLKEFSRFLPNPLCGLKSLCRILSASSKSVDTLRFNMTDKNCRHRIWICNPSSATAVAAVVITTAVAAIVRAGLVVTAAATVFL